VGKQRLYFVQFIGMLVLMCGYFLSDQPDSVSVMHFATDSSASYVLSSHRNDIKGHNTTIATASSNENNANHKYNHTKRVSFAITLPQRLQTPVVYTYFNITHTPALPDGYNYLFYREINPPPPKCC